MSQEEQALLRTRLQEGPDYIFEHPAADVTNRALRDIIGVTGGGESEDPDRELSTIRSIATEALRRHRYSIVMYLRKKVERDGKRIKELKEQRSINLKVLRSACPHEKVEEYAYVPHPSGEPSPPLRVCEYCGVAERGWGVGYTLLKDADGRVVTQVSRPFIDRFQL